MSPENIKNIIFQLLKKIAPDTEPSELKPDENIRETLNIDSFDSLQFIVALNEKLGIEIPEEDYGKITTLSSLISYLTAKNNKNESISL
ncbi:acyl carrier protein [Flavobacterium sp. 83]|jgi:acyl carrier protein|uniref:acyl carrier protein n=1 Tax=Flavobacterium sp. 83 TaxID=1131812 RepID=UPI0005503651|nr:acyl carrier protein [Flavobacterium sp. 83]